jgi:hypothetical protein
MPDKSTDNVNVVTRRTRQTTSHMHTRPQVRAYTPSHAHANRPIMNFRSIMVYGFGMHLPHRIPNAVYALRTYLHCSCLLNAVPFRYCLFYSANLLRVQRATTDVLPARYVD